jgi:hypothetical protein
VLLSLATGEPIVEQQLEEQKTLQSIYVLPSQDRFLLFTNATYRENGEVTYQPPAIPDAPLVNGYAYAFDRESGEPLWPSPAYLEQYGVPLDQPTETPVVLLMRREMQSGANQARRNQLSILCLDRRDGSLIFERTDGAVQSGTGNDKYILEADPSSNSVNLMLPTGGVSLKFTDEPQPPQPPIETGMLSVESPASPGADALGAVFRAIGGQPPAAVPPPPVQFFPQGAQRALPPGVRINAGGQLVPLIPARRRGN